jgi:hypothetical protein
VSNPSALTARGLGKRVVHGYHARASTELGGAVERGRCGQKALRSAGAKLDTRCLVPTERHTVIVASVRTVRLARSRLRTNLRSDRALPVGARHAREARLSRRHPSVPPPHRYDSRKRGCTLTGISRGWPRRSGLGPPGQVDRPAHAAMDSSVDTAPALDAAVDLEHGLITPGPVVCSAVKYSQPIWWARSPRQYVDVRPSASALPVAKSIEWPLRWAYGSDD